MENKSLVIIASLVVGLLTLGGVAYLVRALLGIVQSGASLPAHTQALAQRLEPLVRSGALTMTAERPLYVEARGTLDGRVVLVQLNAAKTGPQVTYSLTAHVTPKEPGAAALEASRVAVAQLLAPHRGEARVAGAQLECTVPLLSPEMDLSKLLSDVAAATR